MQSERGLLDKVFGWGGGFGGLLFMNCMGRAVAVGVRGFWCGLRVGGRRCLRCWGGTVVVGVHGFGCGQCCVSGRHCCCGAVVFGAHDPGWGGGLCYRLCRGVVSVFGAVGSSVP